MVLNTDLLEHEDIKKLSKLEDTLRDYLGDTGLLEEIFRAMGRERHIRIHRPHA